MTFKDIFGGAASTSPTPSNYYKGYHPAGTSQPVMSEREGFGYDHGYAKFKTGNKMDKKHAAMSALTLLAFLFFLNILQNCLKEQVQPFASDVTMMMVMPAKQVKHSSQLRSEENPWREEGRKTRSLLEAEGNREESTSGAVTRREKFIRDLKKVDRKWESALTQLTDKELENQRIKTDNLRLYLTKLRPAEAEAKGAAEFGTLLAPIATERAKESDGPSPKAKYPAKAFVRTRNRKRNFGDEAETEEGDWVPSTGYGNSGAAPENSGGKIWANYERPKEGWIKNHKMEVDAGAAGVAPVGKEAQSEHWVDKRHRNHKYPANSCCANRTAAAATGRKPPPKRTPFQHIRFDRGNRNKPHEATRPRQPMEFRYKHSSHEERTPGQYPAGTAATTPQAHEPGFDFIRFVWTMLSRFAEQLAKVVPGLAKVGGGEHRCRDLLICEAHRLGKLMGPTAEGLASAFSTLAMWNAAEENRQSVIDAVSSGRENTCQQQISDCDERSGGRSAMTVLARVLETKME